MSKSNDHYIVGVHITNRVENVPSVQAVFTEFGCYIKTRLGLHEISEDKCSANGLVLIELLGDNGKIDAFVKALKAIKGVDVQSMTFRHD